ncbi:pilus assembly FimT family protein [Lentilactobacillus kefiri]|uniref:Type II secretion system protein n=1 Tax=Lentilactobacillus kefiri TaxID=33962 RepID=A0A511DVS2_LENKE|nr:hypothetical protein [Lentilactobacillus kefiri]MCJ2160791.1 hypothetical protein [Lentilactobacillus kefiri]MCP9368046.1 hypothetical protein [Lentilactobacillus kefiri]MDH5107404.1 hypothetical protein [Lentilactobacillus kefiri]MDM7491781.1 hypothetical protein [Lentilactobacillus kefiri]PAK59808.1 hypothetical protein B9K02_04090 [Lentilactobacillus kefiri]
MKLKSRTGFTVVELIVYLGVVIGVLMINLMLIKVVQSGNASETIFWHSFQSTWTRMTLNAKANDISYRIVIQDEKIIFAPSYLKPTTDENHKVEILKIPNTMHVSRVRNLYAYQDGFSAPTTVIWLDQNNRVKYYQKVQMGWSGYHVEKN